MRTRTTHPLALTLGLSVLLLAGCDAWALSIGGDGLIFVSVIDDDGHRRPRGGYRIRVRADGRPPYEVALPPDGRLRLDPPADGPVELALVPPAGCRAVEPSALTVTPSDDGAARATFRLAC